jgi:hypothetical protein
MQEGRSPIHDAAAAVCEGLKQIGDFSYAIMPKDVAHAVGDLKKACLTQLRGCIDWEIDWVENRVAGGDRLRDEWREKCRTEAPAADTTSSPGV